MLITVYTSFYLNNQSSLVLRECRLPFELPRYKYNLTRKSFIVRSLYEFCVIVFYCLLPHSVNYGKLCFWHRQSAVFTACSELCKVLFFALWLFCLRMKYLGSRWMDLRQIHRVDIFSPSLGRVWMSTSKVKGHVRYLRNHWTDLWQIHREDVFGLWLRRVWRSRSNVKVTRNKKRHFWALSVTCVRLTIFSL